MVVLLSLIFTSVILSSTGATSTTTGNEGLPVKCTRTCLSIKPVCGSDEKTYLSECHLKKRTCVEKDLVKQCNGPCTSVRGHSCCNIKKKCPKSFRKSGPVCGTNDVTYPNMCLLAIAICKDKKLKIRGETKCSDIVPTTHSPMPSEEEYCVDEKRGKQCSGECKTVNDVHCCDIRTRCPQVFKESGPVCGTDGVSYVNQCVLAKKTCRTAGLLLEKDYDGECKNKKVTTFASKVATTEETKTGDSVTDSKMCYDAKLGKKCTGECKFVHGVDCCIILEACPLSFKQSGPVCGNDNVTYSNLCTLSRAACQIFDSPLRHSYMGVCKVRGADTRDKSMNPEHTTTQPTPSITEDQHSRTLRAYTAIRSTPTSPVLSRTMTGQMSVQYTSRRGQDLNEYRTEAMTTAVPSEYLKTERSGSLSVTNAPDTYVYCNDTTIGKHCPGECKSVNGVHCCDIRQGCPVKFKRNLPVCGTDFVTYTNHCELAKKACRTHGTTLRKLNDGVCKEETAVVRAELENHFTQFPETDRFETTVPETISPSATVAETFIPSTPTINEVTSPTLSTQLYNKIGTEHVHSRIITTFIETISKTTFGYRETTILTEISLCQDNVLGKDCNAECKFVSGVHCCDIIESGCPKSFMLSGHVCGSDGFSYSNLCVLARTSCQTSGSNLVKVSYGTCDETSPIIGEEDNKSNANVVCVDEKRGKTCDGECKVVNKHHCCDIRNRCPQKLKKTGWVCGSDGRTYGNQCALARKSCREHGSDLQMEHKGSCKRASAPSPTRPSKSITAADNHDNNLPGEGDMTMPPFLLTDLLIQRDHFREDPCRADCPSLDSPVCGTNMVTYKNACELKKVQCKRPSIRQFCDSRCRLDDGRNCCMMMKKCHKSLRNTGIVCGSDGKNYGSECDLLRESCRSVDYNLQKVFDGPCPSHKPQTTKKKFTTIECLATFLCPIEMAFVGAVCSDIGTTYRDECDLRRDSCWGENRNIGLDYIGRCKP